MRRVVTHNFDPGATRVAVDETLALPLAPRWTLDVPHGSTRPLKWDDWLVFTDDGSRTHPPTFYSADAATGQLRWQRTSPHRGKASIGVLVEGKALYFHSDEGGAGLIDIRDGREIWRRPEWTWGQYAPALVGHTVVVDSLSEGEPVPGGIDWRDGTLRWRRSDLAEFSVGAATSDRVLFRGPYNRDRLEAGKRVVCVAAESGEIVWDVNLGDASTFPPPGPKRPTDWWLKLLTVQDGAVYCGTNRPGVICLDATTGVVRWSQVAEGLDLLKPLVADGRVYATTDEEYLILDAATGALVHKVPLARRGPPGLGLIVGPYYVFASANLLRVLDRESGRVVWQWRGRELLHTSFVSEGRLYATEVKSRLICFEPVPEKPMPRGRRGTRSRN